MVAIKDQIQRVEERWEESEKTRDAILAEILNLRAGNESDWRVIDDEPRFQKRLEELGLYKEADALSSRTTIDFNPAERILGASQLSGIEFFEKGLLAARAVARVEIRRSSGALEGFGSGVMISPRLFMTNNHVLDSKDRARSSLIQFEYLHGVGGPREPIAFTLDPDLFFISNERLDFTIVAVQPTNEGGIDLRTRGWCHLIPRSGKAIVGERVNIIQHPGGERMQIAVRDNTLIQVVDDFLHYMADTQPGSSGSPVFNDQWDMAALHHAGKPRRDANDRILMTNGQPWTGLRRDVDRIDWESNEGVRISRIVQNVNDRTLSSNEQALWEQSFTAPPSIDIWSLFSRGGALDKHERSAPFHETVDENGNPSWLFRLSFGPISGPNLSGGKPTTLPTPSPSPSRPPAAANRGGTGGSTPPKSKDSDVAVEIFERFRHDGPYYDNHEDAEASARYWRDIDWNANASDLFRALNVHLEATHQPRLSYAKARLKYLYPAIDLHEDGKLKNIYSNVPFDALEAIASEIHTLLPFAESFGIESSDFSIERLIGDDGLWDKLEDELANEAALPFNCEHIVCQSWFDKRQPMKADLHHLFACEPRCNSFRSNIPYWQFPPDDEAEMEECGRTSGRSKFEPAHGKGPASRATLYFLVRYPGEVGDRKSELTKSRINILLDWHRSFPVGSYERHRNWLTEKAQGNRNPFIDKPEIATPALIELGFG